MPETEKPRQWQTNRDVWSEVWGASYNEKIRERFLDELLRTYDADGRLGNVIVDIGSGAFAVTEDLPERENRRIIGVDIGHPRTASQPQQLSARFDVNRITTPSLIRTRLLKQVSDFLELPDMRSSDPRQVDTFILSSVLNYLDYQPVMLELDTFLKPGGRVIVVNQPEVGFVEAYAPNRPQSNDEFEDFMLSHEYSYEPLEGAAKDYAYLVMVLRKSAEQPTTSN